MDKKNQIGKLNKRIIDLENKIKELSVTDSPDNKTEILHQEYLLLTEELTASNEELYAANDALKDSYDYVSELNLYIEEQKALLESVFLAIPGTLIIIDKKFNIIKTNKAIENAIDNKCYTLNCNRTQVCDFCDIKEVFKTGEFIKKEVWDAEMSKYKEIRFFPIKNKKNKVKLVGEIWFDISNRKQTEEEVYALNLNLIKERSLFISGNVFVFHWKNAPNWPVEYVSPNISEVLGYTDTEFISGEVKFIEIVFKEDLYIIEDATEPAMRSKQMNVRIDDFRIKHKNGKTVWLSEYITFIYDENMNITNFYGYATDVTLRKQAEKAIVENEKRYRQVFENAPIGFYRTNPEGEILLANKALIDMLGFSSFEELKTTNTYSGYAKNSDKELFNAEMRIVGEVRRFETEWIKKNGNVLHISENAKAVKNNEGKVVYYEGTVEDITERKIIETNLRIAKEKAEEADKLKSAFLANMSHEIRTPLNGILGFLQLIQNEDITKEERTMYFEIINKAGEQLLTIISDILDISKLEVGQLSIYIEEFDVNSLFDNIYKISKPNFDKKGIELILSKQSVDDFKIKSDEVRLIQIINNLIQNALKFTEKGYVNFGYNKKDDKIEIFVKDTGIGIKPDKQKLIFDRFRQSEDFISKKYGGTGLGLSISKGLVKLLGGEMKLTSISGKGSKFCFELPLGK